MKYSLGRLLPRRRSSSSGKVISSNSNISTRWVEFGGPLALLLLGLICARTPAAAQTPVTTWHYDNERTSANTSETLLTLSNVNRNSFGKLFSKPVDGFIVGHPLYLPGLTMPGQGTRNVVFVATMHNSVYAFDADNANAAPLWVTSVLSYGPPGATSVPATVQKNAGVTAWTEVGIISTPVIDPTTGTLYVVAETYEGTNIVHRLHALDVTTGLEKFGGPATIAATYTLGGVVSTFQDFYQINRPGLLLANGHIYIAFGSNCCNAYSQGWVMSYNATTLKQEGAFDAEPGRTLASVWQKGAGISADSSGNIYAETGEGFYAPGTNLSTSIFKLSQVSKTLTLADYFTPYNYQTLSSTDMDMAEGVLILPDQPGPFPHEAVAVGKEGTIYVLNRDNMGKLCTTCTSGDTQIVQELTKAVGYESGTPVYWDNRVYFTGTGVPALAYTLSNGKLQVPAAAQSIQLNGSGHGLITANGNANGILWFISGSTLWALNAQTMKGIYTSDQAANSRDKVPPLAHFASPIAADGRVFIGTQNSLVVYGLLPELSAAAGNGQTAGVSKPLPIALKVRSMDPYSSNPYSGVTVTFSDSNRGGVFSPPTAVTDSNGYATTSYTLPGVVGTYTITASAAGNSPATFTETAVSGTMTAVVIKSGYNQSAPLLTPFPAPVVAKARDANGNGIPGIAVTFTSNGGGTFSANPVTTDSAGLASVNYTTGTKGGNLQILATVSGFPSATFYDYVIPGPPTAVTKVSGDAQAAAASTLLPKPLVVKATDQYGNVVPGVNVTFADGGAGGSFSANPVVTGSTGTVSVSYTTPAKAGTVTIKATVNGVSTAASFTVTVN
jgi:Bacterial Ig-like domain (group 1)